MSNHRDDYASPYIRDRLRPKNPSADKEAEIRAWKRDPENAALLDVEEVREALVELAELAAAREQLQHAEAIIRSDAALDSAIRVAEGYKAELAAARERIARSDSLIADYNTGKARPGYWSEREAKLREAINYVINKRSASLPKDVIGHLSKALADGEETE